MSVTRSIFLTLLLPEVQFHFGQRQCHIGSSCPPKILHRKVPHSRIAKARSTVDNKTFKHVTLYLSFFCFYQQGIFWRAHAYGPPRWLYNIVRTIKLFHTVFSNMHEQQIRLCSLTRHSKPEYLLRISLRQWAYVGSYTSHRVHAFPSRRWNYRSPIYSFFSSCGSKSVDLCTGRLGIVLVGDEVFIFPSL
jgi:hypothetical protein